MKFREKDADPSGATRRERSKGNARPTIRPSEKPSSLRQTMRPDGSICTRTASAPNSFRIYPSFSSTTTTPVLPTPGDSGTRSPDAVDSAITVSEDQQPPTVCRRSKRELVPTSLPSSIRNHLVPTLPQGVCVYPASKSCRGRPVASM